jgi:hypothetical protein
MAPLGDLSKGKILNSWKEIGGRLGVTVRTVQRWEKIADLPVYRGTGKSARIFAYAREIDQWLAARDSASAGLEEAAVEAHRALRLRYRLTAGFAALALAVASLWFAGFLQGTRVPRHWSLEGSKLTVRDARQRICWERQFPLFHSNFEPEVRDKVLIADIDGDGRQEVLFNYFPRDLTNSRGSLMCFEASGRLRWEFRYGSPKTFAGRHFEPTYKGNLIRPVRIGGRPYLLTVANHYIWYPSQIALLDPVSGRLVEEYWHPGAIYHCVLHDLDADGQEEVVFGGLNNPGTGLGRAAAGVLKLPFSKAPHRSPSLGESLPQLTGGGELSYVLFPTPDVSQVLGVLPEVWALRVDGNRVLVEVRMPEFGAIVYYLNFDLSVQEYRFSDNFIPLHERLYRQHLLDHPLGSGERAMLGRAIPFSAAPDGNSPDLLQFWTF